jgi:hypothetical protein
MYWSRTYYFIVLLKKWKKNPHLRKSERFLTTKIRFGSRGMYFLSGHGFKTHRYAGFMNRIGITGDQGVPPF